MGEVIGRREREKERNREREGERETGIESRATSRTCCCSSVQHIFSLFQFPSSCLSLSVPLSLPPSLSLSFSFSYCIAMFTFSLQFFLYISPNSFLDAYFHPPPDGSTRRVSSTVSAPSSALISPSSYFFQLSLSLFLPLFLSFSLLSFYHLRSSMQQGIGVNTLTSFRRQGDLFWLRLQYSQFVPRS